MMATDRQTIFEDEIAAMMAERRAEIEKGEQRIARWGAEIAVLNAKIESLKCTLRDAQQP
ncbi:hypothetical protein LCGC14_2480450 [marine sediment metagenome]|uniref:Uncharacterized protein n=1 Tax=marine sediment metagenome TaxID=412755 RepID=A0A0F9B8J2_9ZZZZ